MPLPLHTIEFVDGGSMPQNSDKVVAALKLSLTNAVGGGAGLSVNVVVSGLVNLPPSYIVIVNPKQDATWYVADGTKTSTGFTVVLSPRLAANTLAAGTIDVLVLG